MRAARSTPRPLSTYLVERYWPGVTVEAFTDAAERVRATVGSLQAEGERIAEVVSTLVPEDEAAYWMVEAVSLDLVKLAFTEAQVPFDRILAAIEVGPAPARAGQRGDRRDG